MKRKPNFTVKPGVAERLDFLTSTSATLRAAPSPVLDDSTQAAISALQAEADRIQAALNPTGVRVCVCPRGGSRYVATIVRRTKTHLFTESGGRFRLDDGSSVGSSRWFTETVLEKDLEILRLLPSGNLCSNPGRLHIEWDSYVEGLRSDLKPET